MVLADNVIYRCECDFQWEAPKLSRELIASAIRSQPLRGTNLDRTSIEQKERNTGSNFAAYSTSRILVKVSVPQFNFKSDVFLAKLVCVISPASKFC